MIKSAFAGTKGAVSDREKQETRFQDLVQALGMNAQGQVV
jgi:hypothetical protein